MKIRLLIASFILCFAFCMQAQEPIVPMKKKEFPPKDSIECIAPQYPGGEKAMYMKLAQTMKYPKEAAKKGAQGTATILFNVNEDGKPSDYEIFKSTGNEYLDAEALRCAQIVCDETWTPGTADGLPVKTTYELKVTFRLQK